MIRRYPELCRRISTHALREEGDCISRNKEEQHGKFLPTPSARRATDRFQNADGSPMISTHALREEGDIVCPFFVTIQLLFLPTPSARRATCGRCSLPAACPDFYPRPPRGGRRLSAERTAGMGHISTHALREEGDSWASGSRPQHSYFYPRPPRGGRPRPGRRNSWPPDFYPRPPRGGRRVSGTLRWDGTIFLPTPSARRATAVLMRGRHHERISTHALREEGDHCCWSTSPSAKKLFLPTPSARRATPPADPVGHRQPISTHALREEGDIHEQSMEAIERNFYPRPPRGGRR